MRRAIEVAQVAVSLLAGGLAAATVFAAATMDLTWISLFARFTVPIAMLFGIPVFYLLRECDLLGWLSVSLVGALASSFLGAVLFGLMPGSLMLFGGAGLVGGIVSYAVWLLANMVVSRTC